MSTPAAYSSGASAESSSCGSNSTYAPNNPNVGGAGGGLLGSLGQSVSREPWALAMVLVVLMVLLAWLFGGKSRRGKRRKR